MASSNLARRVGTNVVSALALASFTLPASAQPNCDGRGTELRPATVEPGPPLGCLHAPDAPAWRLLTPEFHDVTPRAGWHLTAAQTRPRLIARYRCTGFWLLPVVLREVLVYGHVLDVTAIPCAPPTPPRPRA